MMERTEGAKQHVSPGSPILVLMVAQAGTLRETLAAALTQQIHVRCLEADTAEDGIRLWRENRPGCIVLEDQFLGMPAAEFVDRIADADHKPPCAIVVLAAAPDEIAANELFSRGVQDYLVQHISLSAHLPLAVQNSIRRFELYREQQRNSPIWESASGMFGDPSVDTQAAEAVREGETLIRALFENAPDGFALTTSEIVLYANQACASMFGYGRAEDLVGMPLLSRIAESGREFVRNQIRQRLDGGSIPATYSTPALRADGSEFILEVRVSMCRIRGQAYFLVALRDVTMERVAGEALRVSEERFRGVFAEAAIGLNIVDVDRPGLSANPAFCKMTGYSSKELASMSVAEITHPDDRAASLAAFEQITQGVRTGAVLEKRYVRKDGGTLWARTSVSGVRDSAGQVRQTIGVIEDISEQKRSEQALRENAERFQQLTQSIHQVFWFIGIDPYRCQYASPAFESIWGIPVQALYDDPYAWLRCIHPDEQARASAVFERWLKDGAREPYRGEYRIVRPDGSVRWISHRCSAVTAGPDGNFCASGFAEDITERKAAEELIRSSEGRLKLAQRAAGLGAWEWDARTHEGTFSDEYLKLYGRTREQMCRTSSEWFEYVHPDDRDRVRRELALAKSGDRFAIEFRIIRGDGAIRWIAGWGQMLFDSDGAPLRRVGVDMDLTDRKNAELELRRSQAWLERLTNSNIIGIIIAETDGLVTEANEAFLRMLGYDQADLAAGRIDWRQITPAEWAEADLAALESGQTTGSAGPYEKEFVRKDGSRVPVMMGAAIMPDGHQMVCFVQDLTERKRITRELEQSERRFRALVENGFDYITLLDANAQRIYCSPSVKRVLGYESHEWAGRNSYADMHPDDIARNRAAFQELLTCCGGTVTLEVRFRRKDGVWIWVESVLANLLSEPGIEAVVINSRDITERKRAMQALEHSERRFRALIEGGFDPIIVVDRNGTKTYASPSTLRMLGYTWEEFVGGRLFENVHPDDLGPCQAALDEAMTDGGNSTAIEARVRRKDGAWIWVEGVATNLLSEPGVESLIINAHDITDRKRAMQVLEQSERRFRALIEHGFDQIILVDQNGRRLYHSPSTTRLSGYQSGELDGKSIYDKLHPDDIPRVEAVFREVMTFPGSTRMVEVRVQRSDGSWRWSESAVTNLLSEPGIEAVVINARDITERKRVAQELELSERRFRALIEHSFEQITLLDRSGTRIYASPSMLRVVGYRPEERVGGRAFELVHPDDVAKAQSALRDVMASPGGSATVEMRVRRKDGIWIWTDNILTNLLLEPSVDAVVVNSRDVTERKLAEQWVREANERLNALVQAAPVAICEIDTKGRLALWNPAAAQMFGWGEDEVLGKRPPFLGEESLEECLGLTAGGEVVRHQNGLERPQQRKDGSQIEVSFWTAPLHDAAGRMNGILAIMVDISERKELEEKLKVSEKMKAIGLLAGGIAHDFNNLLTIIIGYSKLLQEKLPKDHALLKHATVIHDAGERAAALTGQLLAFSRQQVTQPRVLDLNVVLERSTSMLQRMVGGGISLDVRLLPGGIPLRADPSQLDQIILNMVVNARDAMPEGGSITIRTSVLDVGGAKAERLSLRPGRYAALSITDTGHGMDNLTQARIFEPFFTTKEQGKGTGLGLSTVYGIIQQSAGAITVQSELGRGTHFTIFLALADAAADSHAEIPADPPTAKAGPRSGTILLVEDEASLRELVSNALVEAGYVVWEASGGQQALSTVGDRLNSVDLLLTDVLMPGMGGLELVRRLRTERPELPVIFVSGYNDRLHEEELERGTELMRKPFSVDTLLNAVNRHLLTEPIPDRLDRGSF